MAGEHGLVRGHRPRRRRPLLRRAEARAAAGDRARLRGDGRVPADRVRAPPPRVRHGRGDDPPGGRPERARGGLREGLLRRPGDRGPPLLQGQAQPPPARAAAVRARREAATSSVSGIARWGVSARRASPRFGPDSARAGSPRGVAGRHGGRGRRRNHGRGRSSPSATRVITWHEPSAGGRPAAAASARTARCWAARCRWAPVPRPARRPSGSSHAGTTSSCRARTATRELPARPARADPAGRGARASSTTGAARSGSST